MLKVDLQRALWLGLFFFFCCYVLYQMKPNGCLVECSSTAVVGSGVGRNKQVSIW